MAFNGFVLGNRRPQAPIDGNVPAVARKTSKKPPSKFDWRSELLRIYSSLHLQRQLNPNDKSINLFNFCKKDKTIASYQRISYYWKELKFGEFLELGLPPNDWTVTNEVDRVFPLVPKARKSKENTNSDQPRTKKKRSGKEWSELLIGMYTFLSTAMDREQGEETHSVKSYCRSALKLSDNEYRRVIDVWKKLGLHRDLELVRHDFS